MKYILILLSLCCVYLPAYGAQGYPPADVLARLDTESTPAVNPAAVPPVTGTKPSSPPTEMDYLSPAKVPLSAKERKALQLSGQWARHDIQPYLAGGGKLVYVHGASLPTVIAAPMQICDVELQPGEIVNEIVVGDSSRWMVESGTAGNTVHLFIKAVDSGLESSLVVTTDRRVYHIRLISQRKGHTPYVGFTYADELQRVAVQKQQQNAKTKHWQSTSQGDQLLDLSDLNFNYTLKGKASWKPERVYDDGRQTFIQLPKSTRSGEMPVLLVKKGRKEVLVNYRIKDATMIVDGLFDTIALIAGVGSNQESVEVRRQK